MRSVHLLAFAVVVAGVSAFAAQAGPALAAPTATPPAPSSGLAGAPRTLEDYKHFRAASIDLLGRMPTRQELSAFERPGFDLDAWILEKLDGAGYAERMTRIWMDTLRLEVAGNVVFAPEPTTLFRAEILGPDKKAQYVYFRNKQRRAREATDGEFCLTEEEAGVEIVVGRPAKGERKPVSKAVLDANTVVVKPWWLYKDYRSAAPTQRFGDAWEHPDPAYIPTDTLLKEPDGTKTVEIRVCKEEAQTADHGHVYVTGREPPKPAGPLPPLPRPSAAPPAKAAGMMAADSMPDASKRARQLPPDTPFAKAHKGEEISCRGPVAVQSSIECGCGEGLERCVPSDNSLVGGAAFNFPARAQLGMDEPFDVSRQSAQRWYVTWWSEEARHFLGRLFALDRDFREVVTSHATVVNGPLVQFYRYIEPSSCCGAEAFFGMQTETAPLFLPERAPPELAPSDASSWLAVEDRGPEAAGILTTPIFLEKYASPRARGAAVYNAFLCKSFIAENTPLPPSTEPNLTVRPGCSTCHATLEPLAAYFSRIEQGSPVYLPPDKFPTKNPTCKMNPKGKLNGQCQQFYDPAFTDATGATLRSAYASPSNADGGAAAAGKMIASSPDFVSCVVQRTASSFLGRPLGPDDAALLSSLKDEFASHGFRSKPLVRALVLSSAYRRATNAKTGGSP